MSALVPGTYTNALARAATTDKPSTPAPAYTLTWPFEAVEPFEALKVVERGTTADLGDVADVDGLDDVPGLEGA